MGLNPGYLLKYFLLWFRMVERRDATGWCSLQGNIQKEKRNTRLRWVYNCRLYLTTILFYSYKNWEHLLRIYVQPAPSMMSLVCSDPSQMVCSDPPKMVCSDPYKVGGSLQTVLEGSLQSKDVIDGAGCTDSKWYYCHQYDYSRIQNSIPFMY